MREGFVPGSGVIFSRVFLPRLYARFAYAMHGKMKIGIRHLETRHIFCKSRYNLPLHFAVTFCRYIFTSKVSYEIRRKDIQRE